MKETLNKFIPLKVGVTINSDEISVVRQLEGGIIQITMRNGKNEYVLNSDLLPYATEFFKSIFVEASHA